MIQKVNSLSSNVYTSHGEILKNFFFFFKYVELPSITTVKDAQGFFKLFIYILMSPSDS